MAYCLQGLIMWWFFETWFLFWLKARCECIWTRFLAHGTTVPLFSPYFRSAGHPHLEVAEETTRVLQSDLDQEVSRFATLDPTLWHYLDLSALAVTTVVWWFGCPVLGTCCMPAITWRATGQDAIPGPSITCLKWPTLFPSTILKDWTQRQP